MRHSAFGARTLLSILIEQLVSGSLLGCLLKNGGGGTRKAINLLSRRIYVVGFERAVKRIQCVNVGELITEGSLSKFQVIHLFDVADVKY